MKSVQELLYQHAAWALCPGADTLCSCWREQAWPLVAHCSSLTRLCLQSLPSSLDHEALTEQLPRACPDLRELQLLYKYSSDPPPEPYDPHRVRGAPLHCLTLVALSSKFHSVGCELEQPRRVCIAEQC